MADTKRTGKALAPPQAIHDCHALLLWIIPQLDKFPRLRRYTLGERIETLLLQVLERLLEAAYSSGRDKTRALQRASQQLNVVRHLWRLSHELKAVPPVYRKNKRPVGHEQANIDPGILPLSCLLVVTLGGNSG